MWDQNQNGAIIELFILKEIKQYMVREKCESGSNHILLSSSQVNAKTLGCEIKSGGDGNTWAEHRKATFH